MTLDTCERFVGPVPVSEFLTEFVSGAQERRPTNQISFPHSSISQHEDEFIQAIEASGICPKLKSINTTSHRDKSRRSKPNISIYSECTGNLQSLNWKLVDLWIVNKSENEDIFSFLGEMKRKKGEDTDKEENAKEDEVEDELESRMDTIYRICRQLIGYALEHHQSQFRVFSFSIFLFGQKGRLLRWDHSGVIYTEPFDWLTEPDTLLEFIWRFNFLSDIERGYDTTVAPVTDNEAEVAIPKLKRYPGLENTRRQIFGNYMFTTIEVPMEISEIILHHAQYGIQKVYLVALQSDISRTTSQVQTWYTSKIFGGLTFLELKRKVIYITSCTTHSTQHPKIGCSW
ncbi:hypothetical protein B0F90DRAFT_1018720 [Multifurca ochricompacta]|uniref:Fungal-type protein kinase domain-containing protein n=1 Tax=Multifurca ochricompacta TaxID=376703 RepID=A0AAD4QLL1_9AGAM|nr:hypothetical protein B0F90DRAFT_1018720 [Multifurca ochricompacta]